MAALVIVNTGNTAILDTSTSVQTKLLNQVVRQTN